MRTRLPALLAAAGLAALVAGCVTLKRTPEARFFALRSTIEALAPAGPPAGPPAGGNLLGVLPVTLPGHLDRPQVVTWTGPGEIRIDEFLRWAEPLDSAIARVLAEDLAALLPEHRVIRAPWPSRTPLVCRVRVELSRFGPREDGEVGLEGRFVLLPERSERPYVARSVRLRRGGPGRATDPGAGVEAMSELLGDLGREVAAAVRALPADDEDSAGTE